MKKSALVLLADGFEEVEALTVVDILRRAKVEVVLASISDNKEVISTHNIKVVADALLSEVNDKTYDLVFLPGGMPGAINLAQSFLVNEVVIRHAQDRLVSAICASPAVVLGPALLLEGKKATCYPGCESYYPSFNFEADSVVVSGNIITAKAAGSAFELSFTLLELLFDKERSDEIRRSIYY